MEKKDNTPVPQIPQVLRSSLRSTEVWEELPETADSHQVHHVQKAGCFHGSCYQVCISAVLVLLILRLIYD